MEPIGGRTRHPAPLVVLQDSRGRTVERHPRAFGPNVLLVVLHGPGCPGCSRIAQELWTCRSTWEAWGTRVVVLHSEPEPFQGLPFLQARDPDGATRRRYAGPEADVVLACLGHGGTFMDGWWLQHPEGVDWQEVRRTVRWVAVQEPECAACSVDPAWEER